MNRKITPFLILSILIGLAPISQPLSAAALLQTDYALIYDIDYSNVPSLTYRDLTLQIDVGVISEAAVFADGAPIAHAYDSASGLLQFTTDASSIEIGLTDVADTSAIGALQKATLKNDKKWAWSVGFDDNVFLKSTLAMLESYGYRGTIFQIAKDIDDTRIESWIIDKPDMITYIENGWSLGNHTWDHDCYQSGDRTATIVDGYNRIAQIISESNLPGYQPISFAAPCFDSEYHPFILNLRDAGTTAVQFNESGSNYPMVVDAGQTADFVLNGKNVFAFNIDNPIGRDTRVEYDLPNAIAEIDWIAAEANSSHHFWHNALAHGGNLSEVQQMVDHIYNTYGEGGTDEVWVAPSDHIYSYLLVRDNATITIVDSYNGTPPSAQPPGQVTQIGPLGDVSPGAISFTWQVEPNATGYELVVYRMDTNSIEFYQSYQSSGVCGSSECSVTPTTVELELESATYLWLARAFNLAGSGPWSTHQQ